MAPRETENNAYAKFWGVKQRALWYVMVFSGVVDYHSVHLIRITIRIIVQSKPAPKTLHFLMPAIAPHAGPFRGARIWSLPSLPANACSTENNIPFPFFYSRGT